MYVSLVQVLIVRANEYLGHTMITQGLEQNMIQIISFLSIREEHSKQHKPKTGSKHKNGHNNGLIANRWLDSCSLKEPGETSQSRYIMELVWSNGM